MGSIYRPKYKARDGTVKESKTWWVKFYRDGHPTRESTETEKRTEAERFLKDREGSVVRGEPITPKATRVRFRELAEDVVTDYVVNGRSSVADVRRRFDLHLLPVFGERRALAIVTADVNAYVAKRQAAGATNGTINRELTAMKRAFSLGLKGGKIRSRPHIPMLRENNIRAGFFDVDRFEAVVEHLPDYLAPVARFAYVTGWRIRSEVLNLKWRQIDMEAGWVRLEPGTTKNRDGRQFPFTEELRAVLEAQKAHTEALQRERGIIIPWVFHREGRRMHTCYKAWNNATVAAGCPGMLMHDFRRSAVRNLTRSGVVETVAMKLTGHRTRSVFERYNIVSEGDLLTAASKLDNAAGKDTGKVGLKSRDVARR